MPVEPRQSTHASFCGLQILASALTSWDGSISKDTTLKTISA
jgi:hypothetical protein